MERKIKTEIKKEDDLLVFDIDFYVKKAELRYHLDKYGKCKMALGKGIYIEVDSNLIVEGESYCAALNKDEDKNNGD